MANLGSDGDQLGGALEQLAALLEAEGESHYAKWAAEDAISTRAGNVHGAEHFLSGFHGIGDFNDVVLSDQSADAKMRKFFEIAIPAANRLVRRS